MLGRNRLTPNKLLFFLSVGVFTLLPTAAYAGPMDWLGKAGDYVLDATVGNLIKGLMWLLFKFATGFLVIAGWFLDNSIRLSIDSATIKDLTTLYDSWALMRDIANMFFIFILLYIAIATILRLSGVQWKQALVNLIIVALLINFSLFFTRVIFDASNILAVGFYNEMKVQNSVTHEWMYGPSTAFMRAFNLQSFVDGLTTGSGEGVAENYDKAKLYLFGAITSFVVAYVFGWGGAMFIGRTVAIIFLMILSPLAFAAMILPSTRRFSSQWWDKLLSYSFVAPIFLGLIYVAIKMIVSSEIFEMSGAEDTTFYKAVVSDTDRGDYAIFLNFAIIIGMFWLAMVVSQKLAGDITSATINMAKRGVRYTGYGVAGVGVAGGLIMRNSFGRNAQRALDGQAGEELREKARRGDKAAAQKLAKLERRANSQYDIRNTMLGKGVVKATNWTSGSNTASSASGFGGKGYRGGTINTMSQRGQVREDQGMKMAQEARIKDAKSALKRIDPTSSTAGVEAAALLRRLPPSEVAKLPKEMLESAHIASQLEPKHLKAIQSNPDANLDMRLIAQHATGGPHGIQNQVFVMDQQNAPYWS